MCNVKCEGRISVRQLCVFKLGLLFAALAWLPSAHADQYPRQSGVEIQDYRFEISLLADSEEISVNETINLSFSADGVRKIDLDLCSLRSGPITPDAFDPCQQRGGIPADSPVSNVAKGMVVTSVLSGDEPLKYEHRDNRLRIYFPRASRADSRTTLSIAYHGVPGSGLLITSEESGDNVFFSDNWSNRARNWLATIDHISLKTPKTFSIIAPSHYQVISNGLLESQVDLPGNRRKTLWREDAAIPTWQFSLGAAPMAVHYLGAVRGVELSAWLSADNKSVDLQSVYTKTKSALEFFSDRIGPYAYQKLANVEAVGGRGAMEFANSIFYFGGDFGALDHEIAHQWFGNTVTEADWDDVWLSEGFATYLALLHTEHLKGRDAFLADLRRTRDGAVKYALANPNNTIVHKNISDGRVLYNAPQIYSGGAMVLHTLRGVMGDDKFWAALHLYYERHKGGHATTDDFRRAAEEVCRKSGDCTPDLSDLSWFFDQWVRRGGLPQVKGEWWYDPVKESVVVSFVQSQTQGFYRIPAEIVIETNSEDQTRSRNKSTVILDGATTTLKIPVDAEPADVRFDPDIWVPLVQTEFGRRAAPPSRN